MTNSLADAELLEVIINTLFRLKKIAGYEEVSKFQHENQHSRFEKDSKPGLAWVEIKKKRVCQKKASIGFFKNKISKYILILLLWYHNTVNTCF